MQPSVAEITLACVFLLAALFSCAVLMTRFYHDYLTNPGNPFWAHTRAIAGLLRQVGVQLNEKCRAVIACPYQIVCEFFKIAHGLYRMAHEMKRLSDALFLGPIYAVIWTASLIAVMAAYLCAIVYGLAWAGRDAMHTLDLLTPSHTHQPRRRA